MDGDPLIEGEEYGGFRHFLAGKPVHAGDGVDLWVAGRWIAGRYESVRLDDRQRRSGVFHTDLFSPDGEETAIPIQDTMRLRWWSRDARTDQDTRNVQLLLDLRADLRGLRQQVRQALADDYEDNEEMAARFRDVLEEIGGFIDRIR